MAEVEGSSPLSPTFETPPEHRSGGVSIHVPKLAKNEEVDSETDATAAIVEVRPPNDAEQKEERKTS